MLPLENWKRDKDSLGCAINFIVECKIHKRLPHSCKQ